MKKFLQRIIQSKLLLKLDQNISTKYAKVISLLLVLALIIQVSPLANPSQVMANVDTVKSQSLTKFVAVLVDEDLWSNSESYDGLVSKYISAGIRKTTLKQRIETYARNIQSQLHKTNAIVVPVSSTTPPESIAAILKQAYFGNSSDFVNQKLVGIVLVGQVPIPVVDKRGNRFPSIYPYTDFEDPIFVYDPETRFFVPSKKNTSPDFEPEIWHGVIDFTDISETKEESYDLLATYLDKNKLFYDKHPDFTEFDSDSIFYSEPIHEIKGLDQTAYSTYELLQEFQEEFIYERYSQALFDKLSSALGYDTFIGDSDMQDRIDQKVAELNLDTTVAIGDLPPADLIMDQPISNMIKNPLDLYSSTLSRQVDALSGTGLYSTNNIFTPITAITQKDEYQALYFKLVNQLLEDRIDEKVEEVAKRISIPNGLMITGSVVLSEGEEPENIETLYMMNNTTHGGASFTFFSNMSESITQRLLKPSLVPEVRDFEMNLKEMEMRVNTISGDDLESAEQCRMYRGGGTNNPLDKTVRITKGPNVDVYSGGQDIFCYKGGEGNTRLSRLYLDSSLNAPPDVYKYYNESFCSVFFGKDIIDVSFPSTPTSTVYPGQLTHESCYNLRTLDHYEQIIDAAIGTNPSPQSQGNSFLRTNARVNSASVNLKAGGIQFSLKDVFEADPKYTGHPQDWNAWSYYLSSNTHLSDIELGTGETVSLEIHPIYYKGNKNLAPTVSSVVKHKDPGDDILDAVDDTMVSLELPINATRYISYVNSREQTQKIKYPSLFRFNSFNELAEGVLPIANLLQDRELITILETHKDILQDLFTWKSLTLNQKYTSIYNTVLDQESSNSISSFPSKFQVAVITADTTDTSISSTIVPDELDELDFSTLLDTDSPGREINPLEDVLKTEERSRSNTVSSNMEDSYSQCREEDTGVFSWFTKYLPCWVDSLNSIGTYNRAPQRTPNLTYAEAISNPNASIQTVKIDIDNLAYAYPRNKELILNIGIYDSNDKVIVGKPTTVTVFLPKELSVDDKFDIDKNTEGLQLFLASGRTSIPIQIKKAGKYSIKATASSPDEEEISTTYPVTIYEQLKLQTSLNPVTTVAGSENVVNVKVKLLADGKNISFLPPMVDLKNPEHGSLSLQDGQNMTTPQEEFIFQFKPSTLATNAFLQVVYPTLLPIDINIPVKPATAKKIYFQELVSRISSTQTTYQVPVEIVDQYSNRISSNIDNVDIELIDPNFSEAPEYKSPISIERNTVNFIKGKAQINLNIDPNSSGTFYLKLTKDGLIDGVHKIILSEGLHKTIFSDFSSPSLYYELKLNSDSSTLARKVLSKGISQTVLAHVDSPTDFSPLFYLSHNGAFSVISKDKINTELKRRDGEYVYIISDDQEIAIVQVEPSDINLNSFIITSDRSITTPGIYLKSNSSDWKIDSENQTIQYQDSIVGKISNQGLISLSNTSYSLDVASNADYFTLSIKKDNEEIGQLVYALSQNSNIHITVNTTNTSIGNKHTYTTNSTSDSLGYVFFDTTQKILSSQKASTSYSRSNTATSKANQGLRDGSKSLLLISAGMTAGEANRSYLGESTFVYGDPLMTIPKANIQTNTNSTDFSSDIGHLLGTTDSDIKHILEYNSTTLLFADSQGNLSLLDSTNQSFSKNILKIPNGVRQMILSKPNSRSESQLIILAEQACIADDSCVYQVNFDRNETTTTPVDLQLPTKAKKLISFDANQDGAEDLLIIGEDNNIYLSLRYNRILQPAKLLGTTEHIYQTPSDLLHDVLIARPNSSTTFTEYSRPINIPLETPVTTTMAVPGMPNETEEVLKIHNVYNFDSLSLVDSFKNSAISSKKSERPDLPLQTGDEINYTLTLRSTQSYSNLAIALPISNDQELVTGSISSPQSLKLTKSSDTKYTHILEGVNLQANQNYKITYTTKYNVLKTNFTPFITTVIDEFAAELGAPVDGIPDIKITLPEEGVHIYYFSNNTTGSLKYMRRYKAIPKKNATDLLPDEIAQKLETILSVADGAADEDMTEEEQKALASNLNDIAPKTPRSASTNKSATEIMQSMDDTADKIINKLDTLRCSGKGCLIMPINYVPLVPSSTIHLPLFGWGCPSIVPTWPPTPFQTCAGGRIYVTASLTAEFVTAVCLGPYLTGFCFPFKVGDIGAACEAVNSSVENLINSTTNFLEDHTSADFGIFEVGNSKPPSGENAPVPGFPSILTDWFSGQIKEMGTLLDLPDITIIYPSAESLVGYFKPEDFDLEENIEEATGYAKVEEAFAQLATLPLFDVTFKDVEIQYPYFPSEEALASFRAEAEDLLQRNLDSVTGALESWGCYSDFQTPEPNNNSQRIPLRDGAKLSTTIQASVNSNPDLSPSDKKACLGLAVNFDEFYAGFTLNLDTLQDYKEIPKNLFAIENFIADYAEQVLSYAEVILDFVAGFLVKNTKALRKWEELVRQIQSLLDDFKVVVDFSVNFMESCDDCRTDRTNGGLELLFDLVLGVFLFPNLPIVEFPRLPDITLDFSSIDAGINIYIPNFVLVPRPITLPNLDDFLITLPSSIPINFDLNFGKYGLHPVYKLPPPPDFEKYVIDFPPLEELVLPELPTLPLPPDLSLTAFDFIRTLDFTLDILSKIIKVICIVMKGAVPVPELGLQAKLESMTNRPLTAVLPIDLSLTLRTPELSYSYISEYKFILETYFKLDVTLLVKAVELVTNEINRMSALIVQEIDSTLQNTADKFIPPSLDLSLPEELQEIDMEIDVPGAELELEAMLDTYVKSVAKVNSIQDLFPSSINLVATTKTMTPQEIKNYVPKYSQESKTLLKDQHQKLLAYKEELKSTSSSLIASIDNVPFQEQESNIARTFKIAQSTDPYQASGLNSSTPTLNPDKGVYIAIGNASKKLFAYNQEPSQPINISHFDYDKDNDVDVIYTRGNQIFFKDNLKKVHKKSSFTRYNIIAKKLSVSDADLSTLLETKITSNSDNQEAILSIPSELQNENIVVDVFDALLSTPSKPYARFVITKNSTNDLSHNGLQEVSKVTLTNKSISKGFANKLYLQNHFKPKINLPLPNKHFRAVVSLFNPDTNQLNIIHNSIPLTPNICKDDIPPTFPEDLEKIIEVAVHEPIILDLSNTTDIGSNIKSIVLDKHDSDNIPNLELPLTQTEEFIFNLPSISKVGNYKIKATAFDEANNQASIDITIKVIAPSIILNTVPEVGFTGSIDPALSNFPVEIIRERDGNTESIGTTTTNKEGEFEYNDIVISDSIVIKDHENSIIFDINQKTGSVLPKVSTATVDIQHPTQAGEPTVLLLKNKGQVITTLAKVSDINQDAQIVTIKPSLSTLQESSNVFAVDTNTRDNIELSIVPGDNIHYAGGVQIKEGLRQLAVIDTNGGIYFNHPDLSFRLQSIKDTTEYQWYEILYNNKLIASVFPTFKNKEIEFKTPGSMLRAESNRFLNTIEDNSDSQKVSENRLSTEESPDTKKVSSDSVGSFQDVTTDHQSHDIINALKQYDVIEGVLRDGERFFEPDRLITRAEYAKIILKILCIEPSTPSYQGPNVFHDILFGPDLPWYYSFTKETYLQKIFTGYLGEINPTSKLAPFKPNNPITLAEATKVVLEALVNTKVINMSNVPTLNPWYVPYLQVAQDIKPYLIDTTTQNTDQSFIITQNEATEPNKFITREEFAIMAYRVLNIKNCFADQGLEDFLNDLIDTSGEGKEDLGTSSQTDTESPSREEDTAGDISSQDTANEGIPSGTENTSSNEGSSTGTSTDSDDFKSPTGLDYKTNTGLYLEQIICITCPCSYRFEYPATFREGDKFYALLRDPLTNQIIQSSL